MHPIERGTTAWYEALDAHIAAHAATPFGWGAHDCITFAADWVRAARAADPLEGLRTWTSAADAARALQAAGGILAAVVSRMGPALPGAMAQVGDVVLVRHGDGRRSAGVCTGAEVAAPGEAGLMFVPITDAEAAWRV